MNMSDKLIANDCQKRDEDEKFYLRSPYIHAHTHFTHMRTFDLSDGAIMRWSNFVPPSVINKTLTGVVGLAIGSTGSFTRGLLDNGGQFNAKYPYF